MDGNHVERIKKRLEITGLSQRQASRDAGMSSEALGKLLVGKTRFLNSGSMSRLAAVLGTNVEWLLHGTGAEDRAEVRLSRVVGYVGAGAEAHFYCDADSPDEEVPTPNHLSANCVAVIIRGTSLGPFFKNALVFYEDRRDPPTDDMMRKPCVVGLTDGRVLIKLMTPGSGPNLYHLHSNTSDGVIEDASVEWAALVRDIRMS